MKKTITLQTAQELAPLETNKATITQIGIEFHQQLTEQEWIELGRRIGQINKAAMFLLGDWLVYGEEQLGGGKHGGDRRSDEAKGRPAEIDERYKCAHEITDLDVETLANAAWVCRNVKIKSRRNDLFFAHHYLVAKLPEDEQEKWLRLAEENKMGKRRLARSIEAGRVLKPEELQPDPNDRPIETLNVWVNRICILWGKWKETGYLKTTHKEKREAMRRDLQPVVDIYEELARNNFSQ